MTGLHTDSREHYNPEKVARTGDEFMTIYLQVRAGT